MNKIMAVTVLAGILAPACLQAAGSERTPIYRYHFVTGAEKLPFTFTHLPALQQYAIGVSIDRMNEKLQLFSMGIYISQSELQDAADMPKVQRRVGIQGKVVVDNTTPAQFQYWDVVPSANFAYAYCTLRTEFDF